MGLRRIIIIPPEVKRRKTSIDHKTLRVYVINDVMLVKSVSIMPFCR